MIWLVRGRDCGQHSTKGIDEAIGSHKVETRQDAALRDQVSQKKSPGCDKGQDDEKGSETRGFVDGGWSTEYGRQPGKRNKVTKVG